jgi:hypothetical protein
MLDRPPLSTPLPPTLPVTLIVWAALGIALNIGAAAATLDWTISPAEH